MRSWMSPFMLQWHLHLEKQTKLKRLPVLHQQWSEYAWFCCGDVIHMVTYYPFLVICWLSELWDAAVPFIPHAWCMDEKICCFCCWSIFIWHFHNICRPSPARNPLKLTKGDQPTMKKKKDESRKRKSALDEIMEVSKVNTRNKYKSFAFTLVSYPTRRSPLVSTMYQCSINI